MFVGDGINPVIFESLGTVESVFISWNDIDGNPADIDGDGMPDDFSELNLLTIPVFGDDFNSPLGRWDGTIGVTLGVDEILCSTNEFTVGTIYEQTFEMTFQSNVDIASFGAGCFDLCVFDPGDINEDGIVSLLDIGGFIDLILTDSFLCQGDFNGDGAVDLLDVQGMIDVLSG